ncbi:MAG: DcaP family trimeric outer membrane transporter [Sulfurimonas sp.]|nr:DcaP family trimeric outer membrane transporter [Sulfurimonas sp.]
MALTTEAAEDISIEELNAQIETLNKRLDAYESKQTSKQKGTLELKTAQTVLTIGGRIDLYSNYSWPEATYSAKSIPLESSGENGQLNMSAKYSRFWIKTRTPSIYGPIRTLIESDFNGVPGTETNTNSYGLRLRHAYIQVGNWGVGQTNSAFNAQATLDVLLIAINDTLVRQPLIRYKIYEDRSYTYDISFEQPETTLLDPDANIITPKDDVLPDVIVRLAYH